MGVQNRYMFEAEEKKEIELVDFLNVISKAEANQENGSTLQKV
jgi:hypothetical protein